jgi:hypothetical protein
VSGGQRPGAPAAGGLPARPAPGRWHGYGSDLTELDARRLGVALGVIAGAIALVAIIAIWLGRKLQVGRNWARIILIVLNGLSLAGTVANAVQGERTAAVVAGGVLPLLCLILLNTRAARSWCHYRTW